MNHLLDSDLEQSEETSTDREISLGPGTILAIFFGLALICGAFFGFGYSMGRRSAQNAGPAVVISDTPAVAGSGTKPSAGSTPPAAPPVAPPVAALPPVKQLQAQTSTAVTQPVPASTPRTAAEPAPATTQSTASAAAPAINPSGTFMVQIAAVSTQEIADIELAALKKYNYPVVIRHEPTDQLLHIQIGPFATRKDAEAMRQNVLAHGFNAIVK